MPRQVGKQSSYVYCDRLLLTRSSNCLFCSLVITYFGKAVLRPSLAASGGHLPPISYSSALVRPLGAGCARPLKGSRASDVVVVFESVLDA